MGLLGRVDGCGLEMAEDGPKADLYGADDLLAGESYEEVEEGTGLKYPLLLGLGCVAVVVLLLFTFIDFGDTKRIMKEAALEKREAVAMQHSLNSRMRGV